MDSDECDEDMFLSDCGGEQFVIDWFENNVKTSDTDIQLGIGDDCAVVPGSNSQLVTTDILIENTHFRRDINRFYDIGWKSIAVNLSDIAAMGAVPTYTFLSLGLPDMKVKNACQIFEGIRDCAEKYGCTISGGDTVFSGGDIVISVVQLGRVGDSGYVRRSGAQVGDAVVVTGTLGDSLAGFKLLEKKGLDAAQSEHDYLVSRHIRPEPRLEVSQALVKTECVHAMMDISDGLCKDLQRLCEASGVGAEICLEMLPISQELSKAARPLKTTAKNLAAAGGEDYELLLTCAPENLAKIMNAVDQSACKLTVIGVLTHSSEVELVNKKSSKIPWPDPWEHFGM